MNFLTVAIITSLHITAAFTFSRNAYISRATKKQLVSKIKLCAQNTNNDDTCTMIESNRRAFINQSILASSILLSSSSKVNAEEDAGEDMTSQMFNEDGSLKAGSSTKEIEAKETKVSVYFPSSSTTAVSSDKAIVSVDGNSILDLTTTNSDNETTQKIKSTYEIPDKWTAAPEYLDTLLSIREKACDHITVYQVPGTFKDNSILEKATTVGVGKALNFASIDPGVFPKALLSADIISGRKVNKMSSRRDDDSGEKNQKYYEFDLAVAPDTCGQSAENLNLGFCPYNTIVLISATIVDERMMVCGVTCTKDEWKRANADLKRVRGSFFVESV